MISVKKFLNIHKCLALFLSSVHFIIVYNVFSSTFPHYLKFAKKTVYKKNPKSILITADNEGEIFKLKIIAFSPSKKVHLRKGIHI